MSIGAWRTGIYTKYFGQWGIDVVDRGSDVLVDQAIYYPQWGLKAQPGPVSSQARELVLRALRGLADHGVETVVLGGTELPLVVTESSLLGLRLIDPADIAGGGVGSACDGRRAC